MTIEVLNWGLSVASVRRRRQTRSPPIDQAAPRNPSHAAPSPATSPARRSAAVHDRAFLAPGDTFEGPALIVEPQTTTLLSADFTAMIDAAGNIVMERAP
jgi:N-methylhydantoinase A